MLLKICFLSYTHLFDDTRILYKEAYSLAQAGYHVTHVSPGNGERHREFGIDIETYKKDGSFVGKVIALYRLYKIGVAINAGCYHCNEVESWVVGCLIKLLHPKKYVIFDVHEHYPSRVTESHFPKWFRWIGSPVIYFLFRLLPAFTDYLVFAKYKVASDFMRYGNKSEFIFNYASLKMVPKKDSGVSHEVLNEFDGDLTAIHIGGMSRCRGWPQLLQAMDKMKNKNLNVLFLGSINEGENVLMEEAKRLGVERRVKIRKFVPYRQVFSYLKCARVGLMLYQPGIINHIYAFPMKMYDYMLAGLPFIGPDFAVEVEPVVREESCGLLVNTSDSNQIAKALDWFCENRIEAEKMGNRGFQAVIRKYNWENEEVKLLKIYGALNEQARLGILGNGSNVKGD